MAGMRSVWLNCWGESGAEFVISAILSVTYAGGYEDGGTAEREAQMCLFQSTCTVYDYSCPTQSAWDPGYQECGYGLTIVATCANSSTIDMSMYNTPP
jgi:hypothetical protein